jgi:hypothetical protein
VKQHSFIGISIVCLAAGVLIFLIQQKWLIINFTGPAHKKAVTPLSHTGKAAKKTIKLWHHKNHQWRFEEASIIWHEQDSALNLAQIVRQWLTIQHDEHALTPHTALEHTTLSSPGSEAYLSFDRPLFSNALPIKKKWLIVESLFKTIHQAGLCLQSISLLVHGQPMDDEHLDFSRPLPLQERTNNQKA